MNRLHRAVPAILLAAALAVPGSADAQMTMGVGGGIVSATFVGDGISDTDIQSRTGLSLGAWLAVPIADRISIVPGAHYVQKGAQSDELGFATATLELAYLEIPVLLSFRLTPAESSTAFSLFAGPSFAFEVGCSIRLTEGSTEVSEDCDDADADERQTFDIGGMLGAGVGFPINDRLGLMLSGGVDLGLRTLDTASDPEDIKNRAFFGSVALTFPVGG